MMMLLQFDPTLPLREHPGVFIALAVVLLLGAALVGYLRHRWETVWKPEREARRRRRRWERGQAKEKRKIDREVERQSGRGRRP